MNCKDRLETYLRDNQVFFETRHHPTAFTAQEVAASEHTPGKMVVKVVMVLADGELVMLAMPAPYQADLNRVGEAQTIVVQAGTHTDSMRLKYADFERLVEPTVGRFAYHA